MKNKVFNILVVGSGLSSLTFIDSYLEKNKKIDVISFNKSKKNFSQINNNHILKILPPQMIGEEKQVNDYFSLNKISIDSKTNFFGSMEFGGLSNYWGLQIDKNILNDILYLSKNTQKKILKSFIEIFNKNKLLGEINNKTKNLFKKDSYIDENLLKKDKVLKVDEPLLAFQKSTISKKRINLNSINEKKEKFVPKNFFKNNLKKKKNKISQLFR